MTVQPPPPQQAWPPPREPEPRRSALPTVALVLAILPLVVTWIAGAVLGFVHLARTPVDTPGRDRAVAAVAIAGTWMFVAVVTVLAVLLVRSGDEPSQASSEPARPAAVDSRSIDIYDLEVGDCSPAFDDDEEEVSRVEVVDCGEPHINEVYLIEELSAQDFPGEETLDKTAEGICYFAFETYVGMAYEDSDLGYSWFVPDEANWDYDHEVVCYLESGDPIRGSVGPPR